jgi:hypothetical protein
MKDDELRFETEVSHTLGGVWKSPLDGGGTLVLFIMNDFCLSLLDFFSLLPPQKQKTFFTLFFFILPNPTMIRSSVFRVVGNAAAAAGTRGPSAYKWCVHGTRQMSSLEGTKTLQNLKEVICVSAVSGLPAFVFGKEYTCIRRFVFVCVCVVYASSIPDTHAHNTHTHTNTLTHARTHPHTYTQAFAAEALAKIRYKYFAQRADVEGYSEVAAAFREVAASEEAQAMGHLEFLQEFGDPVSNQPMGSTKDNLNCAIVSLLTTLNCAKMTACTLIAPL